MDERELLKTLEAMLREDVGSGDISTAVTPNVKVKASITAKQSGSVSGLHEAALLFRHHNVKVKAHVKDGTRVRYGQKIMSLQGKSHDLLPVERTALNVLSMMSGVTTLTRKYADTLKKMRSKARVTATRKTTPGFRYFEKKAVELGGGLPHRMGVYDMILLKDNHLMLFDSIGVAVAAVQKSKTNSKVEVEVTSLKEAVEAAEAGADVIMFDNMRPKQIRAAVEELRKRGLRKTLILEVSGGVNLRNLRFYGKTVVDWISVGALTHSAPAFDLSLNIETQI